MTTVDLFGEVLFDCFPDGRQVLGGAPFNVAWHLQSFGVAPRLVSRVGNDGPGARILAAMGKWGMDHSAVRTDPELPTGRVEINFEDGEPHYDIVHPVAWDAIEAPTARPAGWLYHGSLALRDARSRQTLDQLATRAGVRVFMDVNLRAPWYSEHAVRDRLRSAHWVKLNVDELERLAPGEGPLQDRARRLFDSAGLEGLIVTRGADGAFVLDASGVAAEAKAPRGVEVVDTVGAGDAFSSMMIKALLCQWPLDLALHRALGFAAAVCGLRGATTEEPTFYEEHLAAFGRHNTGQD